MQAEAQKASNERLTRAAKSSLNKPVKRAGGVWIAAASVSARSNGSQTPSRPVNLDSRKIRLVGCCPSLRSTSAASRCLRALNSAEKLTVHRMAIDQQKLVRG